MSTSYPASPRQQATPLEFGPGPRVGHSGSGSRVRGPGSNTGEPGPRVRDPGPSTQDAGAHAPETGPGRRGGEPDPVEWARQIVLRLLASSAKSRAQLEEALRRRNCPDDVARLVLDRMEKVGLVDDAAYTAMLIRSRQAGRGLARRALAHELRQRGIDDETARDALETIDPHAEEERARGLVAKRLPSLAGLDANVQTRRLAGMLARKGYPADLTARVVLDAVREAAEHQRD